MTGSAWVALVLGLAAGNPARRALPLVAAARPVALVGAVLTAAALLVPALAAGAVLGALGSSVPTLLVGAGLVVGLPSAYELVARAPAPLPGLDERGAAGCPVCFPHLLRPQLAVATLGVGAAHGVAPALVVAVGAPLAAAALAAWGARAPGPVPAGGRAEAALAGAGRLMAALGVLASVDVLLDGVFGL